MVRPRSLLPVLALVAWLAPSGARGAVTCSFTYGPTGLAFGAYDPASTAPTGSTAQFTFTCSANKTVTVALSTGAGTFNPRQMVGGTDRLSYNLYQDVAHSIIWGDGTGGSQSQFVKQGSYTIYGSIPTGQWVTPGLYSDTITVTLSF